MVNLIHLENEGLRAVLAPTEGGRLVALDHLDPNGTWQSFMPRPADGSFIGQKATAFPLIPFGGRIKNARLDWQGATHDLPPFPAQSEHVLHGDGMRRAWQIEDQDAKSATLSLAWPSDEWPFAAEARMQFALEPDGLRATMEVTSQDQAPAPFALGWHPYLTLPDKTRVSCAVKHGWQLGQTGFLAEELTLENGPDLQFEPTTGSQFFELSHGEINLTHEDGSPYLDLVLSKEFSHLLVHVPPQPNVIAIEPMSHPLHDLSSSALMPGETLQADIFVKVRGF